MNSLINVKSVISAGVGMVGGTISWIVGGFETYFYILLAFVIIDMIAGVALSFAGKSLKTESGYYSSQALFSGIIKRCFYFVIIVIVSAFESMIGLNFLRETVLWFFIAYEGSSIVEKAAIVGVPVPKIVLSALDIVRSRVEDKTALIDDEKAKNEKDKNSEV